MKRTIYKVNMLKNPPFTRNKNGIVLRRSTFFTQPTPISEHVRSYFLSYLYTNEPI